MAKQKDFDSFLKNIEPSNSTVQYISGVQKNLREYLKTHDDYSDIHKDTFLSGSYAKKTAIRPAKNDKKRDVDIIVVTTYDNTVDSKDVLTELFDVINESSKYNDVTLQHHSISIEMGQISIDVVPVIEDSEDKDLYYIGDSEIGDWNKTDPKGHKTWSTSINQKHNGKYKPLVKIFKWWRRHNCPADIKYPKGIALEKLVADNLGDSSSSTEDLLIETMENMVSSYKSAYADLGLVPFVQDPSEKIEENNLLDRYSASDFTAFINKIDEHINLLNNEGTENSVWRKILGNEFPKETKTKSSYNAIICEMASHRQRMPWPFARGGGAFIAAEVFNKEGMKIQYSNNGEPLEKGCHLKFRAYTGVRSPYKVKWQVTNTGNEAIKAGCLRGYFEDSDIGANGKREMTQYTGSHSIQCFIIKKGICVAKSKDFIVNIK